MLSPNTEADLADAIRDTKDGLRIIGGDTRRIGRTQAQATLSTRELSGIELYEPGALTLVAKAGTPMAEIEEALARENQRLAFEPMDHRALLGRAGAPTIGGVVAANVSGPRRVQAGACRDSLIGVRFVDGAGTVLKNGGRVMKNVTGYDLVKLMCGSCGTLGVLTQVAFKVLPGIATTATLQVARADIAQAVTTMADALGSPFEVSGAAYDPVTGAVSLRLEGFADSVSYRLDQLSKMLADQGTLTRIDDPAQSRDLWQNIRDVSALADAPGDLWRISLKPGDAPGFAAAMAEAQMSFDWGGGLIHAVVPPGTDLRAALDGIAGHATCLRGDAPVFHPEPAALAKLSAGLRAKFDPRGVLNPGLMEA